ncbi:hypothetical protein MAPG_04315 [Magnaporthiopsis poae ATCC 64411]|uniref:Uncharacterized protein n=1 Tax=Magnaporthiopsis poae (strain ATCC 64411 / 73-15) TaxID=644358 RepID=A0A0C4DWD9_MAGP6|nr:hypothetical protein MAPG_04315 [Magnaporthiopsis poae ATCC 64411]
MAPTRPAPTYHRAPYWSIPPPPQGPLQLGVAIADLANPIPLNPPPNQLAIPQADVHTTTQQGFRETTSTISSGGWDVWAKLIGLLLPAPLAYGFASERQEEEVLCIDAVDTSLFFPTPELVRRAVDLPAIRTFLESTRFRKPVYLITGLKVARGASEAVVRSRTRSANAGLGGGGALPGPAQTQLQMQVRSLGQSSFESSSDFVLGYRLAKVKVKRSGGVASLPHNQGARFYDDSEEEDALELEVEEDFMPRATEGGEIIRVEEVAGLEPAWWVL